MPFINAMTTAKINEEKANSIKSKLGKAIEAFPGKSESWLMVKLDDDCKMYFKGSSEDCAYIEISIFGSVNPAAADSMTALVTEIISSELGIKPDRIYIKYEGCKNWGWNGSNF